ncbi:MAG: Tm-1-like ATP-binding domain-containing protein [Rhizobiaceae bacterium]|nr:Tm-1-like ATP-binding domain-containing protein [Rhizobiaceae bacterium]MCV0406019.1 Tm-1-like ATP-binding domain-containing protein [Rhizobiaceae bacterium]
MKRVYVAGAADTKGEEIAFLARLLRDRGLAVVTVDLGTGTPSIEVDIANREVAAFAPDGDETLALRDRGRAVAGMMRAFEAFLPSRHDLAGVIAVGGGAGTAMATAGMRALPLGLPKVMVSTLASGDTAPYVGVSDIVMVPSITDIAGLNRLSRRILTNAAEALAGMVAHPPQDEADKRPALGLTMFGVTTTCVTAIADALRADHDCMVFHATGTGGRAMEKLAVSGMLEGFIDITTTEICDLLVGGVLAAAEDRLDVVASTSLPWIGSLGACDMVNFWAPSTIPDKFSGRTFYEHNSNVTLMRTTKEECAEIGRWIGTKLSRCEGPVRLLIPEKGVSAIDIEGGPFHDPEADAALFEAVEAAIAPSANRRVIRLPYHINDREFSAAAVEEWRRIATGKDA